MEMGCPNSDPNFNKIIGNKTPGERSALYVLCVLVILSATFIQNTKAMPTFMFISLLGGVLQRIQVTVC